MHSNKKKFFKLAGNNEAKLHRHRTHEHTNTHRGANSSTYTILTPVMSDSQSNKFSAHLTQIEYQGKFPPTILVMITARYPPEEYRLTFNFISQQLTTALPIALPVALPIVLPIALPTALLFYLFQPGCRWHVRPSIHNLLKHWPTETFPRSVLFILAEKKWLKKLSYVSWGQR